MTQPLVVVLKTWQGPTPQIAEQRLRRVQDVLASLDKNLVYPNWTLHIADDGSEPPYVAKLLEVVGNRPFTFSSSWADGDIGANLNAGLRIAFESTDVVLNWSDDLILMHPMNVGPYVDLLRSDSDTGFIQTRPIHPSVCTVPTVRGGREYRRVKAWSPNAFLIVTSLTLMHKRAWDFYGPYPEGLRMDIMQEEMAWRYRRFEGGLDILVPEELIAISRVDCGGLDSTWDWQLRAKGDWRYRSYAARAKHGG